jgi:hypothetical protein
VSLFDSVNSFCLPLPSLREEPHARTVFCEKNFCFPSFFTTDFILTTSIQCACDTSSHAGARRHCEPCRCATLRFLPVRVRCKPVSSLRNCGEKHVRTSAVACLRTALRDVLGRLVVGDGLGRFLRYKQRGPSEKVSPPRISAPRVPSRALACPRVPSRALA